MIVTGHLPLCHASVHVGTMAPVRRRETVAGWSASDLPLGEGEDGQILLGRRQPGGTDALLAKYTPDGRLARARGFGGPTDQDRALLAAQSWSIHGVTCCWQVGSSAPRSTSIRTARQS